MANVNVIERILRHLPEGLTDEDCWISTYVPGAHGYVKIHLDDGLQQRLHRVAWEAHNAEPIPEGMVVMHTCDNPACCNPHHLSIGTQKDNMLDMRSKGRAGCTSKRTLDYDLILKLRNQGLLQADIAEKVNCHPATISRILKKLHAS